MHKYRIPIPLGNAAFDSKEAFLVAKQFGQQKKMRYVVKAQVLCGGRGKGYFKENNFQSGVHIVNTPEEVKEVSDKMLKKTLVTKQTGEAGLPCNCVYIVEELFIDKEYYLSLTLDRKAGKPVFIYSQAGGMNIEEVAEKHPEKVFKLHVDIKKGICIDDLL